MELKRQLGLFSAVLIIVADVIGTGIFVTTGSALGMTGSPMVVLALWAIGGLVAITGALCYAELATMWPDDGGEYVYLKKIYGLLPSFLTGWISLTVGFTASVAISSLTLVWYLNEFFAGTVLADPMVQKLLAAGFVFFFGLIHILGVKRGSAVQNALTVLKLIIVFSLIIFGLACIDWNMAGRLTADYTQGQSRGPGDYGIVLLIIMFAYSGWNATTYIAGEIKDPQKNLPRAMFLGTLLITVIYVLLNIVFIMSSSFSELTGSHAAASVAAGNLFGKGSSSLLTLGIAIVLISSVSVQMMVGPRVYYAMAKDGLIFSWLSRINPRFQTPDLAIIIQMAIAIIYVFVGKSSAETLLMYIGFSLSIFPLMSVVGVIIMRLRAPEAFRPFKVPFFPVVPLIYIILTAGMMTASLLKWTKTSLTALAVVAAGVVVFIIWQALHKAKSRPAAK